MFYERNNDLTSCTVDFCPAGKAILVNYDMLIHALKKVGSETEH